MIKKLLKISAILMFVSSCINMNDPEKQAEYIQSLNSFNPRLVAALPDRIPNNMVTMSYSSLINIEEYGNPAGVRMTTRISNVNTYQELKVSFKNKAVYFGISSDTCLTIVDSDEHSFTQPNCNSTFPIPYRSAFKFNESLKDWEQRTNEELYIIDYQVGKVISNSLQEKSGGQTKYSNGFSTGINANDDHQTIEYWMINW